MAQATKRASAPASKPAPAPSSETGSEAGVLRGSVLEVLGALLREQRNDDVITLVEKLVARNAELERKVVELSMKRKSREGVSSAQLALLLGDVPAANGQEREEADKALRKASKPDKAKSGARTKAKDPDTKGRQIPDSLRRIDNPLPVPDEERPCPICGAERTCI